MNQMRTPHWEVLEEKVYSATIPPEFVAAETNPVIDFYIPHARTPTERGLGGEIRRRELRCVEVEIVEEALWGPLPA